jgi:hypothetical protein
MNEANEIARRELIAKINEVDDSAILEEVRRLLDTCVDDRVYPVSDEEMIGIVEGLRQVEAGETLTNEAANREIKAWLES